MHRLRIGDVVAGKYELVRELKGGGMGTLWAARCRARGVDVALKAMRTDPNSHASERSAKRLLQEARAAAQLEHPAIVRIVEFGETELGDPFIAMELLEGEDLGSTLKRRKRISPVKAVRTIMPVAHALACAHDKGIVHRDLKPENIFMAKDESGAVRPKLIDFGVAKLEQAAAERLTAIGSVVGSPGYLSPEQARGDDVDARADIWGFCVVIYEMVTGRLPFRGKSYHALIRSIIGDEAPAITTLGVPDELLWTIIRRGFAKAPTERWPSMRALGVALAEWLLQREVYDDICGNSLRATWLTEPRVR